MWGIVRNVAGRAYISWQIAPSRCPFMYVDHHSVFRPVWLWCPEETDFLVHQAEPIPWGSRCYGSLVSTGLGWHVEEGHDCATFHMKKRSIAAVTLLQDMACSTRLVEKGHAAGTFAKRYHRSMQAGQLTAMPFLNESRVLCRPPKHQQEHDRLDGELPEDEFFHGPSEVLGSQCVYAAVWSPRPQRSWRQLGHSRAVRLRCAVSPLTTSSSMGCRWMPSMT